MSGALRCVTDCFSYRFNHTMFRCDQRAPGVADERRIRDPKASLPFYQDIMHVALPASCVTCSCAACGCEVRPHEPSALAADLILNPASSDALQGNGLDRHAQGRLLYALFPWLSVVSLLVGADRPDKHQGETARGDREALLELTHNQCVACSRARLTRQRHRGRLVVRRLQIGQREGTSGLWTYLHQRRQPPGDVRFVDACLIGLTAQIASSAWASRHAAPSRVRSPCAVPEEAHRRQDGLWLPSELADVAQKQIGADRSGFID